MANTIIVKRSSVPGKAPTAGDLEVGELAVNLSDRKLYSKDATNTVVQIGGGSGAGNVIGPNSATDNAVTRFDGVTGELIQNSTVTLSDDGTFANVNAVGFDTTPSTIPTADGSLYWDSADGIQTLNLVMAGGDVVQQIGQETYYRIKASSAITNGQVVMFTGTVGASGGLTGAPATGLTAMTAYAVMGIATEDIALNDWGYVTAFGLVRGINTSAFSDGQILYLNPSVAGGLTATVPSAPNPKVQVCAVVHAASNGSLFVRPSFGGKLGQFEGDVDITSPASGNTLIYNATAGKWINANLIDGTGISITEGDGSITVTNTAPDQTVALTAGTGIQVTGTYPNFTVTNTSPSSGGTVTSVGVSVPTGLSVSGSPVTTSGTVAISYAAGYSIPTTTSQTNWDTAYSDRMKWDGGSTGLTASTGRTSLGATTLGSNLFTITNPSAVTFPRFNADNTVSSLSAADFRTAIGAGTSSTTGTVTSVAMTVPTGLSVSGTPITSSGTLAVSLASGYSIPTTASQTNWDSAYTQRLQWDGGSTNLTASTGRTSLGATTVGSNMFTLTNPSAITFPRFNADNTVSALSAADFRTAIGAGTSSTTGTVTSVTGGSYLTGGTITTSGTLAVDATSANTASKVVARDASGNFSAGTITASLSGNATTATTASSCSGNSATATTLQTGRTIGMTGDVSYTSESFNGSANVTGTATLANSGVTAGSYTNANITVDAKGRVTSASSGSGGAVTPAAVSDQANTSTGYFALPVGTTAQRPASPTFGALRLNSTIGQPEWFDDYNDTWKSFYTSGTTPYYVQYLVVAGGGGAAWRGNRNGGGGGAGGYRNSVPGELSGRSSSAESALAVTPGTQYTVTIGGGGASASVQGNGASGGNSVFGSITSLGGAGGGTDVGLSGGCGSGGSNGAGGGAGTSGQGWNGGPSAASGYGGGGGGAGENGGTDGGGSGGDGLASAINGTSTYRAGGGAGGGGYAGGDGGGGSSNGGSGVANTGGGGAGTYSAQGGAGGSGIVIIRYEGAQRAQGGTISSANGYTIHTFTSSGTFTA